VSAGSIADAIRSAHAESLEAGLAAPGQFVADSLELVHEPAHPFDGTKDGQEMAGFWSQEGAMLKTAMPDVRLDDLVIAAKGDDEVTLDARMCGTKPDGSALDHAFHVSYSLRDDRIVRAFAAYDPEPVSAINSAAFQGASDPH
jgi:hypothetical protein